MPRHVNNIWFTFKINQPELFIFKVIEGETGDSMLVLETNDEVIDEVIKEYEALLSEE